MSAITPLEADQVLERYFHEARSKLLDVAAILDRIDRGQGAARTQQDPRMHKLREALAILEKKDGARAEQLQLLFSLAYDASWEKPQPR
ncbi:hypothetical protein BH10PLA2_BH10PLA2_18640 [soil metagenome]